MPCMNDPPAGRRRSKPLSGVESGRSRRRFAGGSGPEIPLRQKGITMKPAMIALCCLFAAACPIAAQTTRPASGAWIGQVSGENVYVRSGPNSGAYACLKLSSPQRVTVKGTDGDWLKIQPPAGAFSVIHEDHVAPNADGTTGAVKGNRVRVRAGTALYNYRSLTDHWTVQTHLNQGDKVTIVGKGPDFYRIVPPQGVTFYISKDYVDRIGPVARTTGLAPESGATTRPAGTGGAEDNGADAMPPSQAKDLKSSIQQFEVAEAMLHKEFKKPYDQRDLLKLVAAYKAVKLDEKGYLKPYVDMRLEFLKASMERAKELEALREAKNQTEAEQRDIEIARAKIEVARPPKLPDAQTRGILMPSAIFPGTGGRPKRYVVHDPSTFAITAFAQSTGGAANLDAHIRQEVALDGRISYDRNIEAHIVDVTNITVLNENPSLPEAREPEVKPYTPPAPPATNTTASEPTPAPETPATTVAEPTTQPAGGTPAETGREPSEPGPESTPPPVRPDMGPVPEEPSETRPAPQEPSELPETGLPVAEPSTQPAGSSVEREQFN